MKRKRGRAVTQELDLAIKEAMKELGGHAPFHHATGVSSSWYAQYQSKEPKRISLSALRKIEPAIRKFLPNGYLLLPEDVEKKRDTAGPLTKLTIKMLELKITPEEVAGKLNTSTQNVGHAMANGIQTVSLAVKYARALDCDARDIIEM